MSTLDPDHSVMEYVHIPGQGLVAPDRMAVTAAPVETPEQPLTPPETRAARAAREKAEAEAAAGEAKEGQS